MKKKVLGVLVSALTLSTMWAQLTFAAGANITSYAFADVAGQVGSNTITVSIPYSAKATYWDHKVGLDAGATFTTSALTKIDEQHYQGIIRVTGSDGSTKEYTVKINKNNFVGPTYEVGKAKSIKKDSAKIPVTVKKNDATLKNTRLVYYTKKNSLSYKTMNNENYDNEDIELTGLKADTKYHYYLELQAGDKTYTTSSKTFTTKAEKDAGTSTSNSSSSTNKTTATTQPAKGTNSTGPATPAKEDTSKKNQWVQDGDNWLYFGEDGFSKVGWFQVGDKWYYTVKGTNKLKMSEWAKINGVWYYFDASGAMLANNWLFSENRWYWIGPSGTMLTSQEIDVNGKHYLLNPDGTVADNVMILKNGRYMYYKSGAMGLAINEAFEYNGQILHADENGYVY